MPHSTFATAGRALRDRHWLVWGAAALAVLLALGTAAARPPTYEASALLSIDESSDATQGFDVAMQVDQFLTQRVVAMATSQAVLQQVCAKEGRGCDATALGRQVRVTTPRATAQVVVVAGAPTGAASARIANEVASAVVARNASLTADLFAARRKYLQDQLAQLDAQAAQTLTQANAAEAAGRTAAGLVAQLTALQTQATAASARLQDLDIQAAQMSGMITLQQPATVPVRPVDPDPVLYAAVGGAGGLALGVLAALTAELLRRRVRYGDELGAIAGSPLVLDLAQAGPGIEGAAAYLVRAGLARLPDGPPALLVVAASARDRADDVGMALARAVAGERRRVMVAPAPSAAGAAAPVVLGPAGPRDGAFDLSIRCAPPPLHEPGDAWLQPGPVAAILVATRGRTRIDAVRRAADLLRHAGVEVAGAVLLPSRSRAARRALGTVG